MRQFWRIQTLTTNDLDILVEIWRHLTVLYLGIWKIHSLAMKIAEFYLPGKRSPWCDQNENPRFGDYKGQSLGHTYLLRSADAAQGSWVGEATTSSRSTLYKDKVPNRNMVHGGKAC